MLVRALEAAASWTRGLETTLGRQDLRHTDVQLTWVTGGAQLSQAWSLLGRMSK